MPETMQRSAFRELKHGSQVNLERALRLTDRLGGHLVNGHIDGTGKIGRTWKDENATWFAITTEPGLLKYIVEKGSVAIDGISLTLARVESAFVEVAVIPHTYHNTTLASLRAGARLNIECDILAKYVEKLLGAGAPPSGLTEEKLREMGY